MLITVFVELPYTNHANYADAPSYTLTTRFSFISLRALWGKYFPAPPLAPPALWKLLMLMLMLHQCNVTAPVLIIIIIIVVVVVVVVTNNNNNNN